MERDQQRSRVYAAESLVARIFDRAEHSSNRALEMHGSTLTLPIERRFASVESMQHYVDRLLALRWVHARWPERASIPVTVRARQGQARSHYEPATAMIAIPPHQHNRAWAMREFVLLHEVAHHLAPYGARAAHGPEFADRLLTLVSDIVGPEAGFLLRTAMHDSGVRVGGAVGVQM